MKRYFKCSLQLMDMQWIDLARKVHLILLLSNKYSGNTVSTPNYVKGNH